jgi:hypothetical protein
VIISPVFLSKDVSIVLKFGPRQTYQRAYGQRIRIRLAHLHLEQGGNQQSYIYTP